MFEEQEARAATGAGGGGKDSKVGGRKGKTATTGALEPPLKRSVRGEPKGTPLPPPLTSAPLLFKREPVTPQLAPDSASGSTVKAEPLSSQQIPSTARSQSPGLTDSTHTPLTQVTDTISAAASVSPIPPIPASVVLPIIVGPVPASHPSASSNATEGANSSALNLSTPPIVLHENQLILNPTIFSHLTPAQLRELEALGAQKALEILQGHIVRFLKERIKTEGRTRGRGRGKRTRGVTASSSIAGTQVEKKEKPPPGTGLFTTAPLPPLRSAPPPMDLLLPTPSPSGTSDVQAEGEAGPLSPIVVVDDEKPLDDGPAPKRRRLDAEDVPATPIAV